MGICRLPGTHPKEVDNNAESTLKKQKSSSSNKPKTDDSDKYPHRHLDLRMFNVTHFPCAVLYFTGSDFFNVQMRLLALERGYTLNEYEVCVCVCGSQFSYRSSFLSFSFLFSSFEYSSSWYCYWVPIIYIWFWKLLWKFFLNFLQLSFKYS